MLCYESANRMKAIKAKNLYEKYFDRGFGMKVNDRSSLLLVKSNRAWRVIELDSVNFCNQLEEFLDEIRSTIKNDDKEIGEK